jgi:sugar lactone lactonase YvrE
MLSKNKKTLYLLENHRVATIEVKTGTLSFLAGNPMDNYRDGVGSYSRLSGANQMVLSPDGKKLYIADRNNNRIRVLTIATSTMSTLTGAGNKNQFAGERNAFADGGPCLDVFDKGVAGCAYFDRPGGIAITKDGKTLYIADTDNNRIRKVSTTTGVVTTIAGSGTAGFQNGVGTAARFRSAGNLLLSADQKTLYIVETSNHAVRAINLRTKRVTTLLGSGRPGYREGTFRNARLSYPDSLAQGVKSNILYLSEVGGQRIRELNLTKQTTRLVAGSGQRGNKDGIGRLASFNSPRGMALLSPTYLLVADQMNDLIRAIRLK